MWNTRENAVRRVQAREGAVAVAVDKDKSCQHALKWALDNNIVRRGQTIKLVHVRERLPRTPPHDLGAVRTVATEFERQSDHQIAQMFLAFRCFCTRKEVQCETVVLEDQDVANALIDYVCQNGVAVLLLGSASRNGLSRIFKPLDIPGSVLKGAPEFCAVYVISKGKVNTFRSATRPLPAIPTVPVIPTVSAIPTLENENLYDELSAADVDIPESSPERPSTDSMCFAFYENLEYGTSGDNTRLSDLYQTHDSLRISDVENEEFDLPPPKFRASPCPNSSKPLNRFDSILPSLNNMENAEDKVKRLEAELEQVMNMYHSACKEALAAKQKVVELEQWKKKEERKLQETILAEDTTMQLLERERTKCEMASEAAETARKLVEVEVQKRMHAEMKAHIQTEDKNKVLDALNQAQIALKYQSLFHMVAVLFFFYIYFSLFR